MNLNRSLKTYRKLKLLPIGPSLAPIGGKGRGEGALADSSRAAHSKAVRGMTLIELMVAVFVCTLVLGVIAGASMSASHWFAALASYIDMDAKSRNALDQMTLKIRQAGALTEFSPTHLKFAVQGQTNSFLIYDWDPTTRSLVEWNTGDSTTNILLTGCEQLAFSMYNASFAPTTNLLEGEGLSVNWTCSRTILGTRNTEEMQQALIVIRNKKI